MNASSEMHALKDKLPRKTWVILALTVVLSMAGYVAWSGLTYRIGFPLDDAWIHQTYARNLAIDHQWAFLPGQVSGGSTAPLWSAILAVGYVFRLDPLAWAYLLGGVCLFALALLAEGFIRSQNLGLKSKLPWAGLLIALEWHLVWAAGSGMETLLYALVVTSTLVLLGRKVDRWGLFGILVGIATWIRPDGITLLAPLALVILVSSKEWRQFLEAGARVVFGFGLFFGPYLLFTRLLAGSWWPNTFYAKQAEYASLLNQPLISRLLTEMSLPLIGVGALLLPGFLYLCWNCIRQRDWHLGAGLLWIIGYIALYALRLPVIYQHGRYIIPMMPFYFILGFYGMILLEQKVLRGRLGWVVGKAWVISLGMVLLSFWCLGASSYAQDVAIIETEMVNTAEWVRSNTPPQAVIAAHDIGALGYFGQRRIVDLAGLISPEVVPFIRDEAALRSYLDRVDVDYLVVFPDWYQNLAKDARMIHQSGGKFAPQYQQPNMEVFLWPKETAQ